MENVEHMDELPIIDRLINQIIKDSKIDPIFDLLDENDKWCMIDFEPILNKYKKSNPKHIFPDSYTDEFYDSEDEETKNPYFLMVNSLNIISDLRNNQKKQIEKIIEMIKLSVNKLYPNIGIGASYKYNLQIEILEECINSCSYESKSISILERTKDGALLIIEKHFEEKNIIDYDELEYLLKSSLVEKE
jgi:hypothetical protein